MSVDVSALFSLAGNVALVTGGGTGIGRSIADALHGAGAAVVVAGRREAPLAQTCQALGPRAAWVRADLADRGSLAALAVDAGKAFGAPDIVVHAAGLNARKPAFEVGDEDWDAQIDTMLAAPFFLSRRLVPAMAAKGWGKIVTIASLQSTRAFPDSIPYGAAKGGIVQLTRAMAEAWSRDGIAVNAIAPGFFPTDLTAQVFADPVRAQALAKQTAIGRLGAAKDLHGIAIFLASRASDYITGQVINVDGGFSAK
ncbi:MAG: SDR family oxidoreductase [Azospirillum sp.]|nr:SDR family oxidoreductase [Azospirillum sp.]